MSTVFYVLYYVEHACISRIWISPPDKLRGATLGARRSYTDKAIRWPGLY